MTSQPDGDPADRAYDELQARLPEREGSEYNRGHRYPVGDDARGVVD